MIAGALAAGCSMGAAAQASIALTEPSAPLLPQSFGEWKQSAAAVATPTFSLASVSKDALEEAVPQRSAVSDYARGGRGIHVEAIQFADRSGAFSAFTLAERPGMKPGKELGSLDAVGEGAVLFTVGSSVVLVSGATAADLASLQSLALGMPKVAGNKGVAPLLPSFVPPKSLVDGSVRYALGPATYSGQGGVLAAHSLGWEKSAEAITAQYADKRGKETLTLLLYPTPTIAGSFSKSIKDGLSNMGPAFANAQVRREAELVMLASGTYSADEAQQMLENIHMRQELTFDKDVQPVFHTEVQKTFSLLTNITILSGILMTAAVVLGLFLGWGRAAVRVLRGKPAAVEVEFLSLHLAPQNKPPDFNDLGS